MYFQFGGLALAIVFVIWLVRRFPVIEWIAWAQTSMEQNAPWSAIAFPGVFALCNLLLLPGGVLAMGSGLCFGLVWGWVLNVAGNMLGTMLAFGIGRGLGRNWLVRKFGSSRRFQALDGAIARDGWKIIFLSQLHPLFPTSLLSYLYGITGVRFGTCVIWAALGQAPGMFVYAYLGTMLQFGLKVWGGKSHPKPYETWIWTAGLVVTIAASIALARIATRLLEEANAVVDEEDDDFQRRQDGEDVSVAAVDRDTAGAVPSIQDA